MKAFTSIFLITSFSYTYTYSQKIALDRLSQLITPSEEIRSTGVEQNEHITILLYHQINKDEQRPHRKDEYYFVAKGSGEFI